MAETNNQEFSIEEMAIFCKRKGFIFPAAEIYGGFGGFFDFGPLGVEINNAIKSSWWKRIVQDRDDVVGIDGSVITHQKIWEASGHLSGFSDIMLSCSKCATKVRADQYLEDHIEKGNIKDELVLEGITDEEINKVVEEYNLKCPKCGSDFKKAKSFNLMFPLNIGAGKESDSVAYLRGETAQVIFTLFKNITEVSRVKLPFGIAQIGKAFRNEISPRDFLFRVREFEQMELEFFVHPEKLDDCPFIDEVADIEVKYYDNENESMIKFSDLPSNKWLQYWMGTQYKWFIDLGLRAENMRIRKHADQELAHYASACFDIEYKFPFGWKEIYGNADRSDFDLGQHQKTSGKDLRIFDEATQQKVLPFVASEPSQGVGRAWLAVMFDAYTDDKERGNIVLKLSPELAPVKVSVFPLVKKGGLLEKSQELYKELKKEFVCAFDASGSIGRRYARNDEIGTPYCLTYDFDSLEDGCVTIRDRDSTEQKRVKIDGLKELLRKLMRKEIVFGEV